MIILIFTLFLRYVCAEIVEIRVYGEQNVKLGNLYNLPKNEDLLRSPWTSEFIDNKTKTDKFSHLDLSVSGTESYKDRAKLLDLSGELQVSFLSGLATVGVAGNFLRSDKKSSRVEKVGSKVFIEGDFKYLPNEVLRNIQFDDELEKKGATHVVAKIQYGAFGVLDFTKTWESLAKKNEAGGKLSGYLDSKVSSGFVGGSVNGSLEFNDKELEVSEDFECKYTGSIPITKMPYDYKSALQTIQEILSQVKDNTFDQVPMKIILLPLTSLNNKYKNLKSDITQTLLSKCLDINQEVSELLQKANDLKDDSTVHKYPSFMKKVIRFHEIVNELDANMKKELGELIVKIREGKEDSVLTEFLKSMKNQKIDHLNQWLSAKNLDKSKLYKFFEDLELKDVYVVSNQKDHILRKGKHDVCLILKMRKNDAYLDSDGQSYKQQTEFYASEREIWKKVGQFKRFISNNMDKGFKYHVKALLEEEAAFDCYFEIWNEDIGEIENMEILPSFLDNIPVVALPSVRNLRTEKENGFTWVFWDLPIEQLNRVGIDPIRGTTSIVVKIYSIRRVGAQTFLEEHEIKKGDIKTFEKQRAQIAGLDPNTGYKIEVKMNTEFGKSPKAAIVLGYEDLKNIRVSSVTSRKATFSWSLPKVVLLNSIYGAEIRLTNKITREIRKVPTFSNSRHTIFGLDEGTKYEVLILIKTSSGLIPSGKTQFKTKKQGILITGGDGDDRTSVELFSLKTLSSCTLPSLPSEAYGHSQYQNLVCGVGLGRKECWTLKDGNWITSHYLSHDRLGSSLWPVDDGHILLGGTGGTENIVFYSLLRANDRNSESAQTTQTTASDSAVLLSSHSEDVRQMFTLKYKTNEACVIPDEDSVVVTGGYYSRNKVTRYYRNGTSTSLPDLQDGRNGHACGHYVDSNNKKVFLVTGGHYSSNGYYYRSSTEELTHKAEGWRFVEEIYKYVGGIRAVSIDNTIIISGDYGIQLFNRFTKKWVTIGKMKKKRNQHGMSVIDYDDANC